jgi:hypothetical protein
MVSILMPYYDRAKQFDVTLFSFEHHYKDVGYEVVLVEDHKNKASEPLHTQLLQIVEKHPTIKIKVLDDNTTNYNPCRKYNYAAKNSSGEILIITNPETPHINNVLSATSDLGDPDYMVFACQYVSLAKHPIKDFSELQYDFKEWYQHSQYNPRCIHFCTAIRRSFWDKLGGFDERYADAIAWEDNDFVRMIEAAGVKIKQMDGILTVHLEHKREYGLTHEERCAKYFINEKIYTDKWGDNRIHPFS